MKEKGGAGRAALYTPREKGLRTRSEAKSGQPYGIDVSKFSDAELIARHREARRFS